jgi:hypothetical protein
MTTKKKLKTRSKPLVPRIKEDGFSSFIEAWKSGKPMGSRLARINTLLVQEKNHTPHVHGLLRGHQLLKQSREWIDPSVGKGPSAKWRGAQWRLVLAYSGLELMIKSILGSSKGGIQEKDLQKLLNQIKLPEIEPLKPPSVDRASLNRWMMNLEEDAVLDFLKMDHGDRKRFDNWLLKQISIKTWAEYILLAKALRNSTAHGALSPTKIGEWGLIRAFKVIPEALFKIDIAVFQTLGKERS